MNVAFSENDLSLVILNLEKVHAELMNKAESWGYDLERDYDNYIKVRQEELHLAAVINSMKKQRTSSVDAEVPLTEWEKVLLNEEMK